MVELYFRITEDAVALLIFHFHFVVVCYMLKTEFPFPEIGKNIFVFIKRRNVFSYDILFSVYMY